ncbi:helix-turn-helix domain-containing protein [Archangium lansingense]|uniref:Helix-turn-helix transcriptional regulator n=1 Tax=Archangium lansingense TaxID=2995310 RepID=A0ABT4A363_9BACT|nr:helix-turn-helix transcriptional regulator [Archangium lansinium]MCY1076090.1 helix-turn-helix transcriptional regulator [Archangium lansinium]
MHPKDEKLQPRLGAALRMARMRLELTQEQVAKAVGFVPTVYGRIERGDMVPSTPKLKALCLLLGVSADVLLAVQPPEEPLPPEPPAPPPGDSPELRRLAMILRELPPDRFRLFRVALQTIAHPDKE